MALFDADIRIRALVDGALKQVAKVEDAIGKIDPVIDIQVKGGQKFRRDIAEAAKGLNKVEKAAFGVLAFVKAFQAAFNGIAEVPADIARGFTAVDKQLQFVLTTTAGFVKILKEAKRLEDEQNALLQRNIVLRKAANDTVNNLRNRLQRLRDVQNDITIGAGGYEKITKRIIELEQRLNVTLRSREAIQKRLNKTQEQIRNRLVGPSGRGGTLGASRRSREGSGFGAFSQRVDSPEFRGELLLANIQQVDKLERRRISNARNLFNLEKQIRDIRTQQEKISARDDKRRNRSAQQRLQNIKRIRQQRAANAAIGGGFPLLFGGGPASIAGGVAGGFLGEKLLGKSGGFALSVAFSAIGQAIDKTIASAIAGGKAFNRFTADIDEAIRSIGASGTATGQLLRGVEEIFGTEAGRQAALAESRRRRGPSQTRVLQDLGNVANFTGNAFRSAGDSIVAFAVQVLGAETALRGLSTIVDLLTKGTAFAESKRREQGFRSQLIAPEGELSALRTFENLQQKAKALDTGREKAARDLAALRDRLAERSANLQRRLDRQVAQQRLNNLRLANQIEDQRAANAQQALATSNIGLRNQAGAGPGASTAANALADLLEARLKAENDVAKIQRDNALNLAQLELQRKQAIADIELALEKTKLDTAKKVADLRVTGAKEDKRISEERFRLEQQLAVLRLNILREELRQAKLAADASGQKDLIPGLQKAITSVTNLRNQTKALVFEQNKVALSAEEYASAVQTATQGVDTSGLEGAFAAARGLLETLAQLRIEGAQGAFNQAYTQQLTTVRNIYEDLQRSQTDLQASFQNALSGSSLGSQNEELERTVASYKQLSDIAAANNFPRIAEAFKLLAEVTPVITENNRQLTAAIGIARQLKETQREQTAQLAVYKMGVLELNQEQRTRLELQAQSIPLSSEVAQKLLEEARAVDELRFSLEKARLEAEKGLVGRGLGAGFLSQFGGNTFEEALGKGFTEEQATQLAQLRQETALAELQAKKLEEVYLGIGSAAGELLTTGIRDLITGAKSVEEVFKNFLDNIANILLKAAGEIIATYIAIGIAKQFGLGVGSGTSTSIDGPINLGGSILGPKEVGGRTMANMPYVVGEKGAELFVPGKTGTIVPADVFEATRQAIAGNAPDGGDSDAFAQNSVALGNTATITKENSLVREMGMRENEPIDVRYESTVINNVSYVSEEQFQKGLKTAVAQSKSAVFSDLKNKPSSRAGIGMR